MEKVEVDSTHEFHQEVFHQEVATPVEQHHQIGTDGVELYDEEMPKGYYYSPLFVGTYMASGLGLMAGVGAFAMAAPVLGVINADIGPDASITWVAITYILMLAIGSTVVGRVTDIFGRRWFFVGGSTLAVIGNIVCSRAQSVPVLIGGMTMLGASTAAQASYAFVIGELVPIKYRFLAAGGLYFMGLPFNVFAPKVGVHLANEANLGWRWIFYILIIVNGISTLCWFFFYHPPTFRMLHRTSSVRTLLKSFDYVGFVLFTGGLALVVLGLSWGGTVYAWGSGHVIATLVVGCVSLVVFVFYEIYAELEQPYIPMYLFKNKSYIAVLVTVCVVVMSYYALAIIWPQMVVVLYPSSADALGWKTLAGASMCTVGNISGLFTASFVRRRHYLLTGCMIIGTAFLGAVAAGNQNNQATTIVLIAIGCFFNGFVEAIAITQSSIAVDNQDDIGTAVGLAASVRSLGGVIASTMYTVILANRLKVTIPAIVPDAAIAAGLPASSVTQLIEVLGGVNTTAVPGLTPTILEVAADAYQTANAQAYHTCFLASIAFGVVGIVGAYFCPDADPSTEHIVAKELHHRKDEAQLETRENKAMNV